MGLVIFLQELAEKGCLPTTIPPREKDMWRVFEHLIQNTYAIVLAH
jgi:fatty acid-binding protein DegV